MPHIIIKHFPASLDDERKQILIEEVSATITKVFDVRDGAVSIAIETVEKENWKSEVYEPDIQNCATLLIKKPDY